MPSVADILWLLLVAAAALAMVLAVRARRRSHGAWVEETAQAEVCEHLRPAYDLLLSRGHRAVRVGQNAPELPMEVHVGPPFDPKGVYDELKLAEPVFVSERNVLYCKEDWCEIHPARA